MIARYLEILKCFCVLSNINLFGSIMPAVKIDDNKEGTSEKVQG